MSVHYKALIVVMVATTIMFGLAKPLFTCFMTPQDYGRRRNAWLALTLAAFLLPTFWSFVLVAAVVVGYCVAKESNPVALYLFLLLVIPPLREEIPTLGVVNQLFDMNLFRLLSLTLLLPTAIKISRNPPPSDPRSPVARQRLQAADFILLSYVALQIILMFPYESVTATMRRCLLVVIDVLLPYFVVSRACRNKAMIIEAMAAFALAALVIAPLALFEMARGWILYAGLEERWGTAHLIGYLRRGEYLRAQVTAGHPIVLGYAMAVAVGCWMFLQTRIASRGARWLTMLALVAGLTATLSRGPWVGGVVVVFLFLALAPRAASRFETGLLLTVVVAAIAFSTSFGGKIASQLPFFGWVEGDSVSYRQHLAEASWALIMQNPVFGSPYFLRYLEEFRQGEGIIDLVNVYAAEALSSGLVGLGLFAGFFVVTVVRCFRQVRRFAPTDIDSATLGAGLLACIGGALLILATVSNYLSVTYIYWSLAGLAFAYARLPLVESHQVVNASEPRRMRGMERTA
jgi:hypothetical protein